MGRASELKTEVKKPRGRPPKTPAGPQSAPAKTQGGPGAGPAKTPAPPPRPKWGVADDDESSGGEASPSFESGGAANEAVDTSEAGTCSAPDRASEDGPTQLESKAGGGASKGVSGEGKQGGDGKGAKGERKQEEEGQEGKGAKPKVASLASSTGSGKKRGRPRKNPSPGDDQGEKNTTSSEEEVSEEDRGQEAPWDDDGGLGEAEVELCISLATGYPNVLMDEELCISLATGTPNVLMDEELCISLATGTPNVLMDEELCISLATGTPNVLMDEVHICVLRALTANEDTFTRYGHRLDLSMLDYVSEAPCGTGVVEVTTWPEFVWEWLELCRDNNLSRHSMASVLSPPVRPLNLADYEDPSLEACPANLGCQPGSAKPSQTGEQSRVEGGAEGKLAASPRARSRKASEPVRGRGDENVEVVTRSLVERPKDLAKDNRQGSRSSATQPLCWLASTASTSNIEPPRPSSPTAAAEAAEASGKNIEAGGAPSPQPLAPPLQAPPSSSHPPGASNCTAATVGTSSPPSAVSSASHCIVETIGPREGEHTRSLAQAPEAAPGHTQAPTTAQAPAPAQTQAQAPTQMAAAQQLPTSTPVVSVAGPQLLLSSTRPGGQLPGGSLGLGLPQHPPFNLPNTNVSGPHGPQGSSLPWSAPQPPPRPPLPTPTPEAVAAALAALMGKALPQPPAPPAPLVDARRLDCKYALKAVTTLGLGDQVNTADAGRRKLVGVPYSKDMLKAVARFSRPRRSSFRQEYSKLGFEICAAVLARMCNDLLDLPPFRAEIDSFPKRTPEEMAARREILKKEGGGEEDGNMDTCALCGTAGSVLCCDGCPGAYHLRCINATAKSIPEGEWMCPECKMGGRGESAGLRVPTAGRTPSGLPCWISYGCLFQAHRPKPPGSSQKPVTMVQLAPAPPALALLAGVGGQEPANSVHAVAEAGVKDPVPASGVQAGAESVDGAVMQSGSPIKLEADGKVDEDVAMADAGQKPAIDPTAMSTQAGVGQKPAAATNAANSLADQKPATDTSTDEVMKEAGPVTHSAYLVPKPDTDVNSPGGEDQKPAGGMKDAAAEDQKPAGDVKAEVDPQPKKSNELRGLNMPLESLASTRLRARPPPVAGSSTVATPATLTPGKFFGDTSGTPEVQVSGKKKLGRPPKNSTGGTGSGGKVPVARTPGPPAKKGGQGGAGTPREETSSKKKKVAAVDYVLPPDLSEAPLSMLLGVESTMRLSKLHRRKRGDEVPHLKSLEGLEAGPHSGFLAPASSPEPYVKNPEPYVNKYSTGWVYCVAALKAHVEVETRKAKRVGGLAVINALPVPLPLSRFVWPLSQGKGQNRNTNYLLKAERELWGLLGEGWMHGTNGGMAFKREWGQQVRKSDNPVALARALLQLEAGLRRSLPIMAPLWDPSNRAARRAMPPPVLLPAPPLSAPSTEMKPLLLLSSAPPSAPPTAFKTPSATAQKLLPPAATPEETPAATAQKLLPPAATAKETPAATAQKLLPPAATPEEKTPAMASLPRAGGAEAMLVDGYTPLPAAAGQQKPSLLALAGAGGGEAMLVDGYTPLPAAAGQQTPSLLALAGAGGSEAMLVDGSTPFSAAAGQQKPSLLALAGAGGSEAMLVDGSTPFSNGTPPVQLAPLSKAPSLDNTEADADADSVDMAPISEGDRRPGTASGTADCTAASAGDGGTEEGTAGGRSAVRRSGRARVAVQDLQIQQQQQQLKATKAVHKSGTAKSVVSDDEDDEAQRRGRAGEESDSDSDKEATALWKELETVPGGAHANVKKGKYAGTYDDERDPNLPPILSGWMIWRSRSRRSEAIGYLPRDLARSLARKAGTVRLPEGVRYRSTGRHVIAPRLRWRAATEQLTSAAQLAVQIRIFDNSVVWEKLRHTSGATAAALGEGFGKAVVTGKRQGATDTEYFLQALPPQKDPMEEGEAEMRRPSAAAAAVLAGAWYPEFRVPLYLVKPYEEQLRRDAAAEAARLAAAAQAASREAVRASASSAALAITALESRVESHSFQLCSMKLESKAESRSCQQCSMKLESEAESRSCQECSMKLGGPNDKDSITVNCGACASRFHGECVGMTPEDMEALDGPWLCTPCTAARNRNQNGNRANQRRPYSTAGGALLGDGKEGVEGQVAVAGTEAGKKPRPSRVKEAAKRRAARAAAKKDGATDVVCARTRKGGRKDKGATTTTTPPAPATAAPVVAAAACTPMPPYPRPPTTPLLTGALTRKGGRKDKGATPATTPSAHATATAAVCTQCPLTPVLLPPPISQVRTRKGGCKDKGAATTTTPSGPATATAAGAPVRTRKGGCKDKGAATTTTPSGPATATAAGAPVPTAASGPPMPPYSCLPITPLFAGSNAQGRLQRQGGCYYYHHPQALLLPLLLAPQCPQLLLAPQCPLTPVFLSPPSSQVRTRKGGRKDKGAATTTTPSGPATATAAGAPVLTAAGTAAPGSTVPPVPPAPVPEARRYWQEKKVGIDTGYWQEGVLGAGKSTGYWQEGVLGAGKSTGYWQEGVLGAGKSTGYWQEGVLGAGKSTGYWQEGVLVAGKSTGYWQEGVLGAGKSTGRQSAARKLASLSESDDPAADEDDSDGSDSENAGGGTADEDDSDSDGSDSENAGGGSENLTIMQALDFEWVRSGMRRAATQQAETENQKEGPSANQYGAVHREGQMKIKLRAARGALDSLYTPRLLPTLKPYQSTLANTASQQDAGPSPSKKIRLHVSSSSHPTHQPSSGLGPPLRPPAPFLTPPAQGPPRAAAPVGEGWHKIASGVLSTLMKHPTAAWFSDPVPESVPGYYTTIKRPMVRPSASIFCIENPTAAWFSDPVPESVPGSHTTIKRKGIKAALYKTPADVAADVALIWSNCRSFNKPKSDICKVAEEAKSVFHQLWTTSGLASWTAAPPLPPGSTPGPPGSTQAAVPAKSATQRRASLPSALPTPDSHSPLPLNWSQGAACVLKQVIKAEVAWPFQEPVDVLEVPDYLSVVKAPMDLGTVQKKLRQGVYPNHDVLLTDVALVWSNCKKYNAPGSVIVKTAEAAGKLFQQLWEKEGLPPSSKKGGSRGVTLKVTSGMPARLVEPTAKGTTPISSPRAKQRQAGSTAGCWQAHASASLDKVMAQKHVHPFCVAVSAEEAPNYHNIVKKPMDLSLVKSRLAGSFYASLEQMLADVALVWTNCEAYNIKQSPIYRLMQKARTTFDNSFAEAGLTPPAQATDSLAPSAGVGSAASGGAASQQLPRPPPLTGSKATAGAGGAPPPPPMLQVMSPGGGSGRAQGTGRSTHRGEAPPPMIQVVSPGGGSGRAQGSGRSTYRGEAPPPMIQVTSPGGGSGRAQGGGRSTHRGGGEIPDDWVQRSRRVVHEVQETEVAAPFAHPVSVEDAPDYYSVVQRPMRMRPIKLSCPTTYGECHGVVMMAAPYAHLVSLEDAPDYNSVVQRPMDAPDYYSVVQRPMDMPGYYYIDQCPMSSSSSSPRHAAAHAQRTAGSQPHTRAQRRRPHNPTEHIPTPSRQQPHTPAVGIRAPDSSSPTRQPRAPHPSRAAAHPRGERPQQPHTEPAAAPPTPAAEQTHPAHQPNTPIPRQARAPEPRQPTPAAAADHPSAAAKPPAADLGTISYKLGKGQYTHPDQVCVDVFQVWANALIYNGKDHPLVAMARAAEALWRSGWAKAGLPTSLLSSRM
eukprot:gene27352-4653_t